LFFEDEINKRAQGGTIFPLYFTTYSSRALLCSDLIGIEMNAGGW